MQQKDKISALQFALINKHVTLQIVQKLIELGAEVNTCTADEETTMHFACANEKANLEIVQLLEKFCKPAFDWRKKRMRDETALACACQINTSPEVIQYLLGKATTADYYELIQDALIQKNPAVLEAAIKAKDEALVICLLICNPNLSNNIELNEVGDKTFLSLIQKKVEQTREKNNEKKPEKVRVFLMSEIPSIIEVHVITVNGIVVNGIKDNGIIVSQQNVNNTITVSAHYCGYNKQIISRPLELTPLAINSMEFPADKNGSLELKDNELCETIISSSGYRPLNFCNEKNVSSALNNV